MNQQLDNNKLYKILGVEKNATQEEIKKAYKAKAKSTHPDKDGGSKEEFQAVNEAYATLGDEVKRERYDRTGDATNYSFEQKFESYVAQNTFSFLDIAIRGNTTILDVFTKAINQELNLFREQITRDLDEIKKLERFVKKTKVKKGVNYIKKTLENKIQACKNNIAAMKENIEFFTEVKKRLIEDYEYEKDLPTPATQNKENKYNNRFYTAKLVDEMHNFFDNNGNSIFL